MWMSLNLCLFWCIYVSRRCLRVKFMHEGSHPYLEVTLVVLHRRRPTERLRVDDSATRINTLFI